MSLLTFIQNALGGTGAKSGTSTVDDEAAAALKAGQAEEEGGLLEDVQDVASDVWDTINPLRVVKAASDLLDREVEGAGKLLGLGLETAQETARAGQELGKAGQEGGKAAQEWGKGSQQAAQAASDWSSSVVHLALVGAATLILVMWLRQPPAGGAP